MIDAGDELARSVEKAAESVDSAGSVWEIVAPTAQTLVNSLGVLAGAAVDASGRSDGGNVSSSAAATVLKSVFGLVPAAGTAASTIGAGGTATAGEGADGSLWGSIAKTVLKSGLGLAPLVGSILGLFGGGDSEEPSPMVKYALPPSVQFRGASTEGSISGLDYDQMGMPRPYDGRSGGQAGESTDVRQASGGPQITVNVQAMDARSFLDRSGDIAAAVREAMLNLNSINDVVNEL
jgi:hypothetical protein